MNNESVQIDTQSSQSAKSTQSAQSTQYTQTQSVSQVYEANLRPSSLPSLEEPIIPRVLSIAGTDPTGGAGIQADLKSIMASHGYAMCITTNLVAQNTCGVREVYTPPTEFLQAQLEAVFDDVTIDAVKIGMLGDESYIKLVKNWLKNHPVPVIVLDPVMVATSGDRLLEKSAEDAMREFAACADVITPNVPELAVLCDKQPASNFEEAYAQASEWAAKNNTIVIVKGGHLTDKDAGNTVVFPDGHKTHVPCPRVDTTTTHGTGCSLSSSLATRIGLALREGKSLQDYNTVANALAWSSRWLNEAISRGKDLHVGKGHGPVNHAARNYRLELDSSATPWEHMKAHDLDGLTPQSVIVKAHSKPRKPTVEPCGPWTQALWDATADVDNNIMNMPFIKALGDGTLDPDLFAFYINQDSEYLKRYSRALAAVGAKTPDNEARVHWVSGSAVCIEAESQLHRNWLGSRHISMDSACSPVTLAYVNHLLASTMIDDYVIGAASVLPCYWLYEEVGQALVKNNTPENPYHDWIAMYSSHDFESGVRMAVECVERAFEEAGPKARVLAAQAYMTSCIYEYNFFNQAHRALR
ncbi:bifunctional hydroxymethylpyrimidine kinase/phosphomethylpyrimidine kinase [Gardnerella vaginalis]|uniref:bifunctional hydroxymethylpyrimidine kinase/phosphomethylpyrimidine kinase n=1 Tax=Gardnerella vaginalis TaxID=2702 RepID=UPI0039EF0923